MKKKNTYTNLRRTRYAEVLIVAVLVLTLLIPYPTPKQYFILYSTNLLLVLLFRPRIKTFIDLSLLSLCAMVFFVIERQIYSAQKHGVFIFLLSINIIVTELRK